MKQVSKAKRRRLAIAQYTNDSQALQELLRPERRFNRFAEVIEALYAGEDLSAQFADKRIETVFGLFREVETGALSCSRFFLRDVLVHFSNCTYLLSGPEYIRAIGNMVQFRTNWIRNIFEWKPAGKQKAVQVSELAAYLFGRYDVPVFLYKAFVTEKDTRFMEWYVALGGGASVKALKQMPIPLSKRAAHFFLQAPGRFSVTESLRWAQVCGLGGNDRLAYRVAYSWLSVKSFGEEDFWQSFLRILVRENEFDYSVITEMIDYVREMKRENLAYSLKGRTFDSLLRQTHEWHGRFTQKQANFHWNASGIGGMRIVRKDESVILEELTAYNEVAEEGRAMRHCVASYAYYCANGRSAVFALRRYTGNQLQERMATIEVNIQQRRIVQAKAKLNKPISDEARKYVMIWREKEALSIGPYW